jgi:ParB family chromosome partitioning protein
MAKRLTQTIKDLSLDLIDEPKGILRMEINGDDLDVLAQSISEIGLLQPILVAIDDDRFEVVFGHRRYLACRRLGLATIKAIVREMTQAEVGIARATENIARADLTPLEEALTYRNLIEQYKMSLEQVARKMGKTGGTIKRRMDILKMPPQLQKAVHSKSISMSVAQELWTVADMADLDYYLTFALEGGCTKEVARSWAKDWKDKKRREKVSGVQIGDDLAPNQPRPVYVSCDLCNGPMEIGQELVMRLCPACAAIIKKSIKEV